MEFNWTEIVLALITVISIIVTHRLDKKKYEGDLAKLKAETDSDNIQNMDKSLDFYEKLAESTNKRLDDVLARQEIIINENDQLKTKMLEMNTKMAQLATIICTNLSCTYREVNDDIVKCIHPKTVKKTKKKTE